MIDQWVEKRKYKRFYFSKTERIICQIHKLEEESTSVDVVILNLSAGGLCFSIPRDTKSTFSKKKHLVLDKIKCLGLVDNSQFIKMLPRYIINSRDLKYTYVGCEFMEIGSQQREGLNRYVLSRLEKFPDK